jgi:hypothetical protein
MVALPIGELLSLHFSEWHPESFCQFIAQFSRSLVGNQNDIILFGHKYSPNTGTGDKVSSPGAVSLLLLT